MLAFLLIAAALPAAAPDAARDAAERALALPGARVEVTRFTSAPGCAATSADAQRPIASSGRVALRVRGEGCEGWAWAEVRVFARAWVLTRAVHEGDALAPAAQDSEREVTSSQAPLAVLSSDARAARSLPAGAVLRGSDAREADALQPGAAVQVEVRAGSLVVVQPARVVQSGHGLARAVLPSGKRVEGRLVAGRILVEAQ